MCCSQLSQFLMPVALLASPCKSRRVGAAFCCDASLQLMNVECFLSAVRAVNGELVSGKTVAQVRAMIAGDPDTECILTLLHQRDASSRTSTGSLSSDSKTVKTVRLVRVARPNT